MVIRHDLLLWRGVGAQPIWEEVLSAGLGVMVCSMGQ